MIDAVEYTVIAPDVRAGEGCRVWAFTVIGAGVVMGDRCVIGSHSYIGRDTVMGDDVRIQSLVFLPNRTRLGSRVFIGPGVVMTDDKHPRVNNPRYHAQPPIIDDDVSIGAGAVILPGIHLSRGCMVGAGAIVTHDVPAGETWAGLPAKRLQRWPHPPKDGGWIMRTMEAP